MKGDIAPLYIKINTFTFKIETYTLVLKQMDMYDYRCMVIDHDIRKEIRISFHARDCVWYLCD